MKKAVRFSKTLSTFISDISSDVGAVAADHNASISTASSSSSHITSSVATGGTGGTSGIVRGSGSLSSLLFSAERGPTSMINYFPVLSMIFKAKVS